MYSNTNDYHRPVYTSFELGEMVRKKRKYECKDEITFAGNYQIDVHTLKKIEKGTCSFSPKLYKICSKILGMTITEMLSVEEDKNIPLDNTENEDVKLTCDIANFLFNEIIMQRKINVSNY